MTGSRRIEALCRENVLFMALSADSRPHFTAIAEFISCSPEEIGKQWSDTLEKLKKKSKKIDSAVGRHIYSMRLGIVEPVFGHLNDAIDIKRFTLRSKKKVNGQ